MIKRTLYFGNPAKLSLKDKQLSIDRQDENGNTINKTAAVEDIGIIIIIG